MTVENWSVIYTVSLLFFLLSSGLVITEGGVGGGTRKLMVLSPQIARKNAENDNFSRQLRKFENVYLNLPQISQNGKFPPKNYADNFWQKFRKYGNYIKLFIYRKRYPEDFLVVAT